jgi:hypothetical protein
MTPNKALSIRQPWAHLIVAGIKQIENRTWTTRYRGPLLIHAGQLWHDETIADMVTQSDDPYFYGPFGFVLENARLLSFTPMRGRLGIWKTTSTNSNRSDGK